MVCFFFSAVKSVIQNIAKYKNIYNEVEITTDVKRKVLPSYVNNKTATVEKELKEAGLSVITIGDGDTIVKQYPESGRTVVTGDKVFLVTNGSNRTLEKVVGWSKNDFTTYMSLLELPYTMNGYGFVTKQSVKASTKIEEIETLEVELSNKYDIDAKKEENTEEKKEKK